MNTSELTLFYDGNCPFCSAEIARLRKWNSAGKVAFVDIAEPISFALKTVTSSPGLSVSKICTKPLPYVPTVGIQNYSTL